MQDNRFTYTGLLQGKFDTSYSSQNVMSPIQVQNILSYCSVNTATTKTKLSIQLTLYWQEKLNADSQSSGDWIFVRLLTKNNKARYKRSKRKNVYASVKNVQIYFGYICLMLPFILCREMRTYRRQEVVVGDTWLGTMTHGQKIYLRTWSLIRYPSAFCSYKRHQKINKLCKISLQTSHCLPKK